MKQTCSNQNTNLLEMDRNVKSKIRVNYLDDRLTSCQLTKTSYRIGIRIILTFTIILFVQLMFSPFLQGQDIKITWQENPDMAKKINYNVPEGKALFVFEGEENYNFASDAETIDQPQKVGSIYKLLISTDSPSGAISVFNDDASIKINYGREMLFGNISLPPVNSKDIKYFKLKIEKRFKLENVTHKKRDEGYIVPASYGEKDNLIILFPTPKNLDIQILSNTTKKTKADDGSYRVYVSPEVKKLDLISKGFVKTTIELGDSLGTKNTLYFDVRGSVADEESFNTNINVGDYLLKTDPPGALIELKGNPSFNEQKNKTPFTFKKYEAGPKMVHLTLDRYEPNDAIIVIAGKKNNKSVTLEPKFAFLNATVEPAMPISKVLLDGNELIGIENGKKFEIPKGTHNVEITAPHYYSQTKQINPSAGQVWPLNEVKLSPKMGMVTIEPGENADGAEVYINEKYINKLPISNYSLQEGDYTISYKKSGLVTELDNYVLSVNVNQNKPLKSPQMINLRKIKFSTDPKSGATVYINGTEKGTTPLSLKLPVGNYKVLIKKDNYKDYSDEINLFSEKTEFNYSLTPNYNLSLSSKPSGAEVSVDGEVKGNTPLEVLTTTGTHKVIFAERSSIRRVKYYTTDDVARSKSTVLRKDDFWGIGVIAPNEGVEIGGEIYIGKGKFILSGSISKLKPLTQMPTIVGTPSGVGYGVQAGLRVPYPLDFIIHCGYGQRDFSEKGSSNSSSNGFGTSTSTSESFSTGIAGLTIPFHLSHGFGLYINTDYWLKVENGSGLLMYSVGIIF